MMGYGNHGWIGGKSTGNPGTNDLYNMKCEGFLSNVPGTNPLNYIKNLYRLFNRGVPFKHLFFWGFS
jgi:hypothetical protein